jgi:YVTN family beta-propeller protein
MCGERGYPGERTPWRIRTVGAFLYKGSVPDLHEGDEFAGHRIVEMAGRGGMGVVYRAIQLDLDRPVALKLIAAQLAEDPGFRDRFVRESRAAASIDHPNVIPIYYTGEHEGDLYIAMRYVEGSDLRTLVRAETRLEPGRAAQIVAQVASALDAAHGRGIVHRDVKPANVLLGTTDHVYLTDFGLTKRLTSNATHPPSTRDGGWVGTLGYVAPEQIRGERVDARADVYALGCVLYQALTGTPPYHRESDEATLWAHLNEDPPSVRDKAPRRFDDVLARALAKDPDERYPSAGDLGRAALAAAGRAAPPGPERRVAVGEAAPGDEGDTVGSPDQAPTAVAPPPRAAAARRRAWAWGLAAVPVVALAVIAALVLGGGDGGGGSTTGSTSTPQTPARAGAAAGVVGPRVTVGGRPNSVTIAGGSVWVTRGGNERVAVISAATGKRRSVNPRVGPSPAAATDGFGKLWVAVQSGPAVVPISLRTHRQSGAALALPFGGQVVAVGTGEHAVWVGIRGTPGALLRFDPDTGQQVKRIDLPDGLQNLAVGSGAVWVLARRANTLTRVDIRTGRTTSLNVGSRPADVTVGEGAVWVTNAGDDSVTRIDTGSLSTSQVAVGHQPQGVAVGGGAVWVANRLDSTLTRLDPSGRRVGPVVPVDANPYAVDVEGKQVWVGSLSEGTVQRVDFR